MSDEEIVLKQEAGVKSYESVSPKAGWSYQVGSLIITDQRLVFVSKGKKARAALTLLSPIAGVALEKAVSKAQLEDLMSNEGSYFIPLENITKVETSRKWGGPYLRVDHTSYGSSPVHSYIFGGGFSVNKDFVETLNSAINSRSQIPPVSAPPPSEIERKFCIECGQKIPEAAKFCPKCGSGQY